ncbi:MAG: glycosyltransferase [Propionibacteriaceae bacterium]|nr:glycosyltransferase [Propionibacteriaceae bacterium]
MARAKRQSGQPATPSSPTAADQPLLSVVVPIFNVERYLDECLASLRAQTLTDFEVICVNDGSTDGSRDIIQTYLDADPRFRVIDKPNSGYGASMNLGCAAATGKYVTILESDDFLDPACYEVLVGLAERHDVEVVRANFFFYWSQPYPKDEVCDLIRPALCDRVVNPQREHDIFFVKSAIWAGIYRRDFLAANDIGFLETPGASYQDTGFNFKVWIACTRAWFVQQAYLHYRQDNEASSVNSAGKVYPICDEHAEIERYLAARPERAYLDGVRLRVKFDNYLWNYDRLAPQFKPEFLQRMSQEFAADLAAGKDFSEFNRWQKADVERLAKEPEWFHAAWQAKDAHGYLSKARRYIQTGGPRLLLDVARNKLTRRK